MSNTPIHNGSPKGVTGRDHPQTTQINRRKKCNNIRRSKMMTPQKFVHVWRTTLYRRHVANWQTATGRHDSSRTVPSFGDPLGVGYIGQLFLSHVTKMWSSTLPKMICLFSLLMWGRGNTRRGRGMGEVWVTPKTKKGLRPRSRSVF